MKFLNVFMVSWVNTRQNFFSKNFFFKNCCLNFFCSKFSDFFLFYKCVKLVIVLISLVCFSLEQLYLKSSQVDDNASCFNVKLFQKLFHILPDFCEVVICTYCVKILQQSVFSI